MEPTTQAILVLGLLALLLLLLVGRSVGRRRARRAAAETGRAEPSRRRAARGRGRAGAEPEAEVEPEVEARSRPRPRSSRGRGRGSAEAEPELEVDARRAVGPVTRGCRRRAAGASWPSPRSRQTVDEVLTVEPLVETADQAELRALREQLRALEQVVQQQVGGPPDGRARHGRGDRGGAVGGLPAAGLVRRARSGRTHQRGREPAPHPGPRGRRRRASRCPEPDGAPDPPRDQGAVRPDRSPTARRTPATAGRRRAAAGS